MPPMSWTIFPPKASVQFLRVDAEKEADVSLEFEVAAVPTIIFFGANGKKTLERVEGARVADVTKKVRLTYPACKAE